MRKSNIWRNLFARIRRPRFADHTKYVCSSPRCRYWFEHITGDKWIGPYIPVGLPPYDGTTTYETWAAKPRTWDEIEFNWADCAGRLVVKP